MVQQAEAAYLALKKAPGEESLQQNYTLIRQRAEIWMKKQQVPRKLPGRFSTSGKGYCR
jgi:hypothetical protein